MRHAFLVVPVLMALPNILHSIRWLDFFDEADELETVDVTLSLLQMQLHLSALGSELDQSSKIVANASREEAEQCSSLLPVLKQHAPNDDSLDLLCRKVYKRDACQSAGVLLKKRLWSTEAITEACKWLSTSSALQKTEKAESLLFLRSSTEGTERVEVSQQLDASLKRKKEEQPYVKSAPYKFNNGWWSSDVSKGALLNASKAAKLYLLSTTTTTTTTTVTDAAGETVTETTAMTTTTTTTSLTLFRLQPEAVLYRGAPYFGPAKMMTPTSKETGDPQNADYEDVTEWDVPPLGR